MRVIVKTGNADDFFSRAGDAAKKADGGVSFDTPTMTFSFGDPDQMFAVLSEARRHLMQAVMQTPKSLQELSACLHRPRSSVTKDVRLLENAGLIISERRANPGHGIHKVVRAVAPRIDLVASLAQS